jgi:hypothetical protein
MKLLDEFQQLSIGAEVNDQQKKKKSVLAGLM